MRVSSISLKKKTVLITPGFLVLDFYRIPLMCLCLNVNVKTFVEWYGSRNWKSTISRKIGRKMVSFAENRAVDVFCDYKNIFWRRKKNHRFFSNFENFHFLSNFNAKWAPKGGKMNKIRSIVLKKRVLADCVNYLRTFFPHGWPSLFICVFDALGV